MSFESFLSRRAARIAEACAKAAGALRQHSAAQIANAIRYTWHAWRGFPSATVGYSPVWLDVLITSRCNLRCLQCSYFRQPRQAGSFGDMCLEVYTRILERYPRATAIVLAGGEPLLHPNVFEMIREAHARRLKVHMPTNGTLVARNIEALLEAPVEMLNVSLYGVDRAEFAGVTGGGERLFDDAVRGVRELAARRRRGGYPRILRASYICTKANLGRAADFVRLCEGMGVDQVKLKSLWPGEADGYGESMCLREDDPEVQRALGKLEAQRFRIPVFPPRLYRRGDGTRGCTQPFRLLTIDGSGATGMCCRLGPDQRFGNLLKGDDVWNGPAMVEARRSLTDVSVPLDPACRWCEEMVAERRKLGAARARRRVKPGRSAVISGEEGCRG